MKDNLEQLQHMVDAAFEGLGISEEGKIIVTNQQLEKMLGYSKAELRGKSVSEFVAPESRDLVKERMESGYDQPYEHMAVRKDGTVFPVEVRGRTFKQYDRTLRATGIQDISERKDTEATHEQLEQMFKEIFEKAPIGIYQSVPEGKFVTANTAMIEMLGYDSIEELQALDMATDIYLDSEERSLLIEKSKAGLPLSSIELQWRRKDGSAIWVHINAYTIRGRDGEIDHYGGFVRDITEQKQSEEALRHSEERFYKAFHATPDAITISRMADGCLIDVNTGFERLSGYSREEAVGKTSFELNFWSGTGERERITNLLKENGRISNEDCAFHDKRGEVHDCLLSIELIDIHGEPCMLSIVRDITEHKQAEKALRERGEQFQNLAEQSPSMIFINRGGQVVYANRACEEVMGYSREEMCSPDFDYMKIIAPDRSDVVKAAFEKHIKGEEVAPYEYGLLTKDGRKLEAIITTKLIHFEGDNAILGIVTDITDRIEAEEALRISEEQYRNLVENARDAIFTLSFDGVLTSLNPAFEKITGWDRSQWLGRPFVEILHPEDKELAVHLVQDLLGGSTPPVSELRIRTKPEGYVVGEFTAAAQMRDGRAAGVLGIARDITDRKTLEDQLRQAQKLESLGTLAGGVAHDFNNILNILLAHSHLLSQPELKPERISNSVGAITQAVERGTKVVQQLLTFAGQTHVEFKPVNLNSCIDEISEITDTTFPKTIELDIQSAESLPMIMADSTQIHQVLLNLCVNARDAMPHGGTISITTGREPGADVKKRFPAASADQYIFVDVTDTGTGMDRSTRQRIFEPFFTTKGTGKGTGLGLSVVYGIVEDHNGFLNVRSEPGKGSTFRIYFPAFQSDEIPAEKYEIDSAGLSGGTETLLVVEDETTIRNLLNEFLTSKGYTILTARDGEEAVKVFSQQKDEIDLVLSDIGLPKASGEEVFKKLREIDSAAMIILASGFFEAEIKASLTEAGADGFLQKPYRLDEVLTTIRQTLDKTG